MNQNYSTYRQVDINTSNPLKLVIMLYEGAITFLRKSIEYAENHDIKNKNIYANKARDIIVELNNSLDIESGGEVSQSLRRLYLFMDRQLMQANWKNDIQNLKEVMQLLSNLLEAWQDLHSKKVTFNDHPLELQAMRLKA